MKKTRGILAVFLTIFMVIGVFNLSTLKAKADSGSTVTIYCWNDEFKTRVEYLMPNYTTVNSTYGRIGNVTVKWVMVPSDGGAYQNSLDSAILSSTTDVDIFLVEADYAQKYLQPGIAKPLSELGIKSSDLSNQYTYTKQIGSTNGVQYASTWQTCCGGMIYNRDIARSVLGTDDPTKVQAMVSDWNKFESVANKMKSAGYKMTPCAATDYRVFYNNMTSPWVTNGKVNIDSNIMNWIDMSKSMVDKGQTGTFGLWDTNVDFQRNTSFCVFGPAWYFDFCMQYGSGSSIADRGGWALCEGPQAHYWGGTWICVADKTDNPTTAAKIVKSMTIDESILESINYYYGDNVNNKNVINRAAADKSLGNDVLGGQNPYTIFKDSLNHIDASHQTIYDQICNEAIQTAMTDYFEGWVSKDKAFDNFFTAVMETYPELSRGSIYAKPKITVAKVDTGIKASWTSVPGAAKYYVYRKAGSDGYSKIATTSSLSYTDKTAVFGKTYSYKVRAVNSSGAYTGETSNVASITYKAASLDVTLKTASNGVNITWPSLDGTSKYIVYKKNAKGNWAQLGKTSALKYVDKTIKAGETATYTVVALNADGEEMNKYGSGKSITFLAPAMDVTLRNRAAGVGVSWDKLSGASKYRVYRKNGSSDWKSIGNTSSLSYTDKTAVFGKTYLYSVRALDADGKLISKQGNGEEIKYLVAAPKLTLTNEEAGIVISWKAMTNAAQYNVYVKKPSGRWAKIATVTKGTMYADAEVEQGQSYTYAVVGLDSAGRTMNDYEEGTTIVRRYAVVNTKLSGTNDGVKISWDPFEGATKYRVYRKNDSGKWTKLVATTELEYIDADAEVNAKNTYAVLAVDADGTVLTEYGNGKTIKYVISPTEIIELSPKTSGVRAEWASIGKAEKYALYRKTKSTDWAKVGTTAGLSYTDKSAESGKTYYYSVIALDASGKALNDYGNGYSIKYTKPKSDDAVIEEIEITDDADLGEAIEEDSETKDEDVIEEDSETKEEDVIEEDTETKEEDVIEEDSETKEEDVIEEDSETKEEDVIEEDSETKEETEIEETSETKEENEIPEKSETESEASEESVIE